MWDPSGLMSSLSRIRPLALAPKHLPQMKFLSELQSNSSMHHYYECVALCKDISLQRGRFCARSHSLVYPKIQRRQVIMNVLHLRCAPGRGLQKRLIRSRFGVWTRGTRQLCPGFPKRRGNLGTGHLLAHCGVQRISGVNQSHSVGGSNDADFRCAYCSDLLCYN